MNPDLVPLIAGAIVLLASLISLRTGLSVAIIEIALGAIAGNLGFPTQGWMTYLAGFGGIILTYLAGAEVDTRILRQKFKVSMLIGGFSFFAPFLVVFLYTYFVSHWSFNASMIAGIALSTTSFLGGYCPVNAFVMYSGCHKGMIVTASRMKQGWWCYAVSDNDGFTNRCAPDVASDGSLFHDPVTQKNFLSMSKKTCKMNNSSLSLQGTIV